MALYTNVPQPTCATLAAQVAASTGNGAAARSLVNATAAKLRIARAKAHAILRRIMAIASPAAATVEAAVARGVTAIADGATDSIAGTVAGTPATLTYKISNTGNTALTLGTLTVGTATNCTVTVDVVWQLVQPAIDAAGVVSTYSSAAYFKDNVAGGGSASFTLTVTPASAGAWSFPLSISNNDANENPYNWTVSGTAT